MANVKLPPFLKWRDGRPRWEPSPKLRRLGLKGRDLKDNAGSWLPLAEAVLSAQAINQDLASQAGQRRPSLPLKTAVTCHDLFALYYASQDFLRLRPQTRHDYQGKARPFLEHFGDRAVAAVRKSHILGFWEQMHEQRGHAMANGILAVVRRVFTYAELRDLRAPNTNPCLQLKRPTVPPRVVVWTPVEIDVMVSLADGIGVPSIGDAIIAGLHTGQRQGDLLAYTLPEVGDGRARFRQSKRGAQVSVPLTEQLAGRIEEIRRRRRDEARHALSLATVHQLIVNEATGRPYTRNSFNHVFRRVRAEACKKLPEMNKKQFLDIRDTAVTRLAIAGCSVPEIRAITGHTLTTIHKVLEHYLALDDRMADAAIDKLRQWMDREGIAL